MKDLQKIKEFFSKPLNEESTTFKVGDHEVDFFHTKANVYANIEIPSENPTFEDDIQIKGTGKTEKEAFEDLKRNYENYKKTGISEAKKEDAVDTITMDIPLFLRMLEYSREDASQDMDLHDVTEKANLLGKERGILQMDDYDEIVGAAEEIDESVNLKASKLPSAEYQKAKKLKDFKASDWKWNANEDLYTKVVNEAELSEAYYQAVADLGIKKTKENLDTFEEVQEFLNRMEKRNAISVDITKFNQEGKSQTIKYNWDGEQWVKILKSEINEAKSFTLDSESASDSDKITDFLTSNNIKFTKTGSKIKISLDRSTPKASSILSKLKSLSKFDELNEAELTEAYVPSNIKEFAKRKGVSSLVNKVAGWAEKVGKGIRGGTAIGKDYSTLILDMGYQTADIYINTENGTIELYGEPVENFNEFQRVYNKKDLTERIINRLKNDPRRTKR